MSRIRLGNIDFTDIQLGSNQVNKVYYGSVEIWNSFTPTDPDAIDYIEALDALPGVFLTATEKEAVDNLFIRMKGNDPTYSNFGNTGIWDAARAIYPYVGSNIEAYRYNALVPTFNTTSIDLLGYPTGPGYQYIAGGITVDGIYGPKGNGINGVILTNLNWGSGQAGSLSRTNLCMGAVYKETGNRKDFGEYNTAVNASGIWLRTGPTVQSRQGCLEGSAITGSNLVINGRGHWLLHRSGADKRVYYQGVQQTYPAGADRTLEVQTYHGADTWTWLALNVTYFNSLGASPFPEVYAQRCVNYGNDTLMFSYVMDGFSNTLIPAWNQMVEDFCIETGKKTW